MKKIPFTELSEEEIEMMRSKDEIFAAIDEFFDKVWYNRKHVMFENIEVGKESLHGPKQLEDILQAMEKVEKKYGEDNLGPWDDFEWGMINGKLSALRWILGDEWDMLDT